MRRLALVLLLAPILLALDIPVHVSIEEAADHLLKNADPVYPQLAALGRIQGNVILKATIDEKGDVTAVELLRGHPMLAPAAKDAVSRRKYRPFEVNGKVVPVSALVMVTFNGSVRDRQDNAEMRMEDRLLFAQAAVEKGDYVGAEKQFASAQQFLALVGGGSAFAQWRLSMAMGDMRTAQQKYNDAEQSYQNAVRAYANETYTSPNQADAWTKLAALYVAEKKLDQARDSYSQAAEIYQSTCKKGGCSDDARKETQRKTTYTYWELAKLATAASNSTDAAKWCKDVLKSKKSLDAGDRDSITTTCESAVKDGAGK